MPSLASFFAPLALLAGMAVASPAIADSPPPAGRWLAEDIGGAGVLDRVETTIEFGSDGKVVGLGGCNRYFGKAEIEGSKLRFSAMGGTRMMCPPAVMTQEGRFQQALDATRSFTMSDGKLSFLDGQGKVLARFTSQPLPQASISIPVPPGVSVEKINAHYICDDQSSVEAVYINAGQVSLVTLTRKGEFLVMANVLAASGARYAGGPFVWWTKGQEASFYDLTKGEDAPPVSTCKEG